MGFLSLNKDIHSGWSTISPEHIGNRFEPFTVNGISLEGHATLKKIWFPICPDGFPMDGQVENVHAGLIGTLQAVEDGTAAQCKFSSAGWQSAILSVKADGH